MGKLLTKPGVLYGPDGPGWGGARILEVLKSLVSSYPFDLTVTSARDGKHSGPSDPHYSGNAYDIRSQGLTDEQKRFVLHDLQLYLYREPRRFYAFLEAAGGSNEHFHIQVRNGTVYTAQDYLDSL